MTPDGPAPSLRAAAIDDDTLIREGLGRLTSTLDIVASYATAEAFLDEAPDVEVVLLDLNLGGTGRTGGLQGGSAVAAVARVPYRVLIYTNERRRQVLVGCLAAGALGVVHKAEPLAALEDAAHAVAA